MKTRPPFVLALAGLLAATLLASTAMAQRTWTARGVVREIRPERSSITIHHEPVPGYMREMTMPFGVADRSMLEGIEVGDRVEFTFVRERDGRHTIRRIRVIQSEE
jgi:Cu/Ag efflux protein CusF